MKGKIKTCKHVWVIQKPAVPPYQPNHQRRICKKCQVEMERYNLKTGGEVPEKDPFGNDICCEYVPAREWTRWKRLGKLKPSKEKL